MQTDSDIPETGSEDSESAYCAYTDYTQDGPAVEELPATGEGSEGVERRIWDALYDIEDPEMPISIVDLGLLYGVSVEDSAGSGQRGEGNEARSASDRSSGRSRPKGFAFRDDERRSRRLSNHPREDGSTAGAHATVDMTLTYTGCPARKMLTEEVENTVRGVESVETAELRLVWSPAWSLEMVTEQGRADLREFGLSVPDAESGVETES